MVKHCWWTCSLLLGAASVAQAAWFSELWILPQQVGTGPGAVTIQPLVEVSGLPVGSPAELIVIDALNSPSRYGLIKQRFVLPAGSAVRMLSQSSPGVVFDLSDARSLLLFDQLTGLSPSATNISALTGLNPVDVLTLTQPGIPARPHADFPLRPSFDSTAWAALARPNLPDGLLPWDELFFTGYVAPTRDLMSAYGPYQLNPGFLNEAWSEPDVPEPGTAMTALETAQK